MRTTDIYDDAHDAALAERLSTALNHTAAAIAPPADAWSDFQARLTETGAAAPLFEVPGYAEAGGEVGCGDGAAGVGGPTRPALVSPSPVGTDWTAPPRTRNMRWRVPLIAAASVAVLAVGVAAASTGLLGAGNDGDTHAAAPSTSDAAPPPSSDPVGIPIVCAATESEPCTSMTGATLQFVDDPELLLRADYVLKDEGKLVTRAGGATAGTGDPLGFLMGAGSSRVDTVWGAESPAVATVLVQASRADGGGDDLSWTFDSDDSSVSSPPYSPTTTWKHAVWTEISAGWHGYAVHLPEGYTVVKVLAIGYNRASLQARTLNVATGDQTHTVLTAVEGALATMTGEAAEGVLAEIEASKRAEALQSTKKSAAALAQIEASKRAEAIQSARSSASSLESEASAALRSEQLRQAALERDRARESALAEQTTAGR